MSNACVASPLQLCVWSVHKSANDETMTDWDICSSLELKLEIRVQQLKLKSSLNVC